MSALASLVHAYDRLAERSEAPVFGYSRVKIGFLISLNEDGTTAGPPIDLREGEGQEEDTASDVRTAADEANLGHRAQLPMGQDRLCARRHGWRGQANARGTRRFRRTNTRSSCAELQTMIGLTSISSLSESPGRPKISRASAGPRK